MKRLSTTIGGLEVAVELHTGSPGGPGVGVAITGAIDGQPVSGGLFDLLTLGELPVVGGGHGVRVPEPVIQKIDDWCMQFMF